MIEIGNIKIHTLPFDEYNRARMFTALATLVQSKGGRVKLPEKPYYIINQTLEDELHNAILQLRIAEYMCEHLDPLWGNPREVYYTLTENTIYPLCDKIRGLNGFPNNPLEVTHVDKIEFILDGKWYRLDSYESGYGDVWCNKQDVIQHNGEPHCRGVRYENFALGEYLPKYDEHNDDWVIYETSFSSLVPPEDEITQMAETVLELAVSANPPDSKYEMPDGTTKLTF